MNKRLLGVISLLCFFLLAACQQQATPEDRLAEYIGEWNDGNFAEMYKTYLNQGTKDAYSTEEFVERQVKLQEDLGIKNVEVSYKKPAEETEWDPEKPADFPILVKMETLAGPVEFEKTLTLLHETKEEEENWFVEWDPSFIFPQLEAGDNIRISRTEAARGEITDRNNNGIAVNGSGFDIGIVPKLFTDESKKEELAKLLGITTEFIDSQLGQSWVQPDYFVPIAKAAKSEEKLLKKVDEIQGVTYQGTDMREYPYGEALAHLSGYIGGITAEQLEKRKAEGYTANDFIGRQGLELLLEDRLRGKDGMKIFIEKAAEGAEPITVAEIPAANGETVKLTIDAELQKTAYAAMEGEPGASAAVDPETGETLALVSSPGFDPNEFMLGISGDRYKELEEDPRNPLFNRFAARYAPGSTIKPITAAIGMEAGTLNPSEGLEIEGETWQKDESWGDYRVSRLHPEAPNPIDLNKALVYSDNIYFARQALEMGKETFAEGLKNFGFGEDMKYPYGMKAPQISNEGTIGSEGQLADTSFGQGQMLTNILHLASMYEPFITNGTMYKPTLFLDEEDKQVWKEGLVSAENAETLRKGMRNVVVDGYAQSANLKSVPLAGKTGTAELKASKDEEGAENGFFVAYNSENPDFILAMMVEGVEDNGGSDYVAGFAAKVFEE
ncbi:penicillin-binding transpeptidase domain-containing protein [Planococcus shixiaomingii]|uniref:penicillin-binding transpeptidase domain-containing protein n=1 Tax=Planococcus shixiaomingii TaxID=3058393 RepID=UPI00260ADBA4|nr:penicillin-binding transpeptidase domain-containing protein [Planococcus sp. N022]WKA55738.1 penicillin-binding transpeptidase domain-containing protein [Planococcus sp. N022]